MTETVDLPGGLWEGCELHYDEAGIYWGTDPEQPCPHCHSRVDATRRVIPGWTLAKAADPDWETKYGEDETTYSWSCPRVIVAFNEAGHSSTGVCLDCVLEWAEAHPGCEVDNEVGQLR